MRGWVLLGFAVLVGACGKSSQSGDDLGFGRDAVVTADGGGRGDSGFAEDAVGGGDAAVDRDTGSVPDALGSPDALDAPDAGGSPDAVDSPDALESPDAGDPDTGTADSGPADAGPRPIGAPCSVDPDCAGGAFCSSRATALVSPPQGFCTKFCLGSSDCGSGNSCTPDIGRGLGFCYPVCTSTGGCGISGLACSPTKYQGLPLPEPGCLPSNPLANDGDACDGPAECKPNSICVNNQYAYPHGLCAQMDCGATTCAPGARCVFDQNESLCRKTCTTSAECRVGYICSPAGLCDTPGTTFAFAPCTTPRDCGPEGTLFECVDVDLSTTTPSVCTLTNCIPNQQQCGPFTCESLRSCPLFSYCYVPGPSEPFQLPYCRPM